MNLKSVLLLLLLGSGLGLLAGDVREDAELKDLAGRMKGLYSNEAQAGADKNFFNLSLALYPFWLEREDGFWFYMEQAVTKNRDHPYRQFVYQLHRNEAGEIVLTSYKLREERAYVGAHRKARTPLLTLQISNLIKLGGCDLVLTREDTTYVGETAGNGCVNKTRRARYMTQSYRFGEDEIVSWDRGFTADGTQVWGNKKGAFQFKRIPIPVEPKAK